MRKRFFTVMLTCAALLAGCSKDDDGDSPKPDGDNNRGRNDVPAVVMEKGYLTGAVRSSKNAPLAGVKVTTGSATVTTDANGHFRFEDINVIDNRYIVSFSKSGYHTVSRSGGKGETNIIDVVMLEQGNSDCSSNKQFDAANGVKLSAGGMQVSIQADGLEKADGGAFSGTVSANMLYLSPDNANFASIMPGGDMAAVRTDNSEAVLISYGMVEVSLTDASGNKLQLKQGKEAELTFPIPDSKSANPPATIPLWYFDEGTGLWVEEGVATLRDGVYVGKVSHFSWHNLDVPEERVTLKGKVYDCQKRPVVGVKVLVDQTYAFTDSRGMYSVFVPASTGVTVEVTSDSYFNYQSAERYKVDGQRGGSEFTQDIELPCLPVISGQVVNSCDPNSLVLASFHLEYTVGGKKHATAPMWTAANGKFQTQFPAEATVVKLFIETVGGKKIQKEFTRKSGLTDIDAGLFEICETIEKEILRLVYPNGDVMAVPFVWDAQDVTIMTSEDGLFITSTSSDHSLIISLLDYSGANENHWTGSFVTQSMDALAAANLGTTGDIEAELVEKDGDMLKISITGTGEVVSLTADKTGEIVKISGTITIPRLVGGKVTSWKSIGFLTSDVPAFPTPIASVSQVSVGGSVLTELSYDSDSDPSVASLQKILTDASFSLFPNGGVDTTSLVYASKESFVALTNDLNAEYPLSVQLYKSTSSLEGVGGDTTTEKCWEYTYSIMGMEMTENQWGTEAEMNMTVAVMEQNGIKITSYRATDKTREQCEEE